MAKKFTLPHQMKLVDALKPATDAAGRTSTRISLKTCGLCYIIFHCDQGNAATITLSVFQSQDIAGTARKALAVNAYIWANQDTVATDTLVRQADGVAFTTSAVVKQKQVIIEIDPAILDVANGFDCIDFTTGASNVANLTEAQFLLADLRYQQTTPPTALLD